MSIRTKDMKDVFMKMDRDFVCEALASIIFQLYEHDVRFLEGPQGPILIEYFNPDGTRHTPRGPLPEVPAEERVRLDFSGFKM